MYNVIRNLDVFGCYDREYIEVGILWEVNKTQHFELTDDDGVVKGCMTLQEMYEERDDVPEELLDSVYERQDAVRRWLDMWKNNVGSCLPYPISVSDDLIVRDGKCRLIAAKLLNYGLVPIVRVSRG